MFTIPQYIVLAQTQSERAREGERERGRCTNCASEEWFHGLPIVPMRSGALSLDMARQGDGEIHTIFFFFFFFFL